MSFFLKKLINKVKIASDRNENKKIICISLEKMWDHSIIRLDND